MRFRKYNVNTTFFDCWSADSVYILGFIFTDGNLFDNRLGFELQSRDVAILEFIRSCLSPDALIKLLNKNDKQYSILRINSKELISKLKNMFGLTERKSLTLNIEFEIPTEYLYDFIRGVFDGDGWVRSSRILESQICSGSLRFLDKLKKLCGFGKIVQTDSNLYRLLFNKEESLILSKLMYNGGFYLARKKIIFDSYQPNTTKKHWTLEQIEYLKTNYISGNVKSIKDMSKHLNKSISAVRQKIWKLGISKDD